MKKILYGCIVASTFLTLNAHSATVPAEAFSRANCKVYIPTLGYGWYNESISYDALTGQHRMGVATDQKATNRNASRNTDSGNLLGRRARAGYVDNSSDSTFWNVNGYHRETLDNGRKLYFNTAARDCNLHFGQFL
ncbi:hypothetical protein [Psychrobacter sp. W2-37-MNA-CIBAN-0211]|uniref:hypothetical protein n=1 Tax=Psychrobacter sp. W2-37-MNA-CIBAN-0211 TaxID=3140443 RepID=UPI0033337DA4